MAMDAGTRVLHTLRHDPIVRTPARERGRPLFVSCRSFAQNRTMYLRPYRATDFDMLYALDQVCFQPCFRFSRAMMRQVVDALGAIVILACEANGDGTEMLAGFCAAERTRLRNNHCVGYVATLDVAPGRRGQGVGRMLMSKVEEEMVKAGAEFMQLHVHTGNPDAIRLYERLSYQRVGEQKDFYGTGFSAWSYAKKLRSKGSVALSCGRPQSLCAPEKAE